MVLVYLSSIKWETHVNNCMHLTCTIQNYHAYNASTVSHKEIPTLSKCTLPNISVG